MATFTVRPEGIIRQPALTMPGNATGSEAACTSLTASQIRTLLSLGTTSDVTFDIVRATTSVLSPLFNNPAAAATTLGNSTYGVMVPGTTTFSNATYPLGTMKVIQASNTGVTLNGTASQWLTFQYFSDGVAKGGIGVDNSGFFVIRSAGNGSHGLYLSATTCNLFGGSDGYAIKAFTNNGFKVRNYADSADGPLTAGAATFSGDITASGNVTLTGSTATVAASTSLLRLTSAATGFEFRPAAGYIEQWTSGSDGQYNIWNSAGTKFLRLDYDTALNRARIAADKICLDANNTTGVVSIGQTGNSGDPGLKRGGVGILSARLGDDSADAAFTCAGITASGVVSHGAYTVATLPSAASNAGKMAQVTDSSVAASGNYGATVAAGGANRVKVFSDGTNWVIA